MQKRFNINKKHSLRALKAAFMLLIAAAVLITGCTHGGDPGEVVDITGKAGDPTAAPSVPTELPSEAPTEAPTPDPTAAPTASPEPTDEPHPQQPKRKVYLTIDDGPCAATPKVLDILKQYDAKATFFTVGRMVSTHQSTARRIVEEGHLLACHTQTHDFNVIYKSPQDFANDVDEWRQTVIDAVGYDAGAYVYRFPGGSTNSSVGGRNGRTAYVEEMNRRGYIAMDWNMGINDKWPGGNTEHLPMKEYLWKSYKETYAMYKNVDPLILIIHDTVPETVELLPKLLEDLIAKGFEFGLCDELGTDYLM